MTNELRPGDAVTCANPHCGATVVATFYGRSQPGYPVALAWPSGRTEVTHWRPERCIDCHERFMVLGKDAPEPGRAAPGAPAPVSPAPTAELRTEPHAPPVPCPSCHAGAGEPCRTGTGKTRTVPHLPRQDEELDARERERARRAKARDSQLEMFGSAR